MTEPYKGLEDLDDTIRECTNATTENMRGLQLGIKSLNPSLEALNKSVQAANKASGKLAQRANRLTNVSIGIAVVALLIAAGHLWVNYQALIQSQIQ